MKREKKYSVVYVVFCNSADDQSCFVIIVGPNYYDVHYPVKGRLRMVCVIVLAIRNCFLTHL